MELGIQDSRPDPEVHAGLGEPLLDRQLEERIKFEKQYFPKAQVIVYTNGGLLHKERALRLLESGVDVISISINGFRKETYEAVMKIPRDITYRNAEQLIDIKQKIGAPVDIHVSLVKTDLCSFEEVEEFKQFWSQKHVAVLTPPWISWGNLFEHPIKNQQFPCCYIWKVMMFDYDGTVKMCCEDYDSQFPMGNIMTDNPSEIFNSPRMQRQRSNQLNGNFSEPVICNNCIETYESAQDFWKTVQIISIDKKDPVEQTIQLFIKAIDSLKSEQYKQILGHMLTKGFTINDFDYPKGIWPPPTPARFYIDDFLNIYKNYVKGYCVEFSPPVYKDKFIRNPNITKYDIWNIVLSENVTVVADLQNALNIENNTFDTIICTHVLSAIKDVWKAVSEIQRILKPGGLILCTVPSVLQKYAPDPKDFWRFTPDSVKELFAQFSNIKIHSYGNAATVAGSPFYLMIYHFPEGFMLKHDENCPSIIAIAAWK